MLARKKDFYGFKDLKTFNQNLQIQKEHFHKLMDLINTQEVFSMMGMSKTTESYSYFVHWKYRRNDSYEYETYLNDNCDYTKEFRLVIAVGGPCNGYKDFVKMLCLGMVSLITIFGQKHFRQKIPNTHQNLIFFMKKL